MALLFGPAGTPHSARSSSTVDGLRRVAELGLGCMEIQFVQGVKMGEKTALAVAQVVKETGLAVSVHAPYAINFNAQELEKVAASQERLFQAARIGYLCGARDINFHAGFYLKAPPGEVYPRIKASLQQVTSRLRKEGIPVTLRIEVAGKHSEFGTLEEVLRLSQEVEGLASTIDFAHWHARSGGANNSYEEFRAILELVEAKLGRKALGDIHIHVSGIRYSKAGELSHLNFQETYFRYRDFLRALRDKAVQGMVICESPNLEEDALLLQEAFRGL